MEDLGAGLSTPGTWRKTDPGQRYYIWLTKHHHSLEDTADLRAAWSEAWRQACWATLKSQAELGLRMLDLSQRLGALERQLEDLHAEQTYEAEIEQASYYWALSNANAEEHAIVGEDPPL
jgi:hypothetical protein